MRLLHVYSGNLFGGIERMLLATSALPHADIENVFALCFDGDVARILRSRGARVELLGPVRMRKPWSVLRGRRALERALSRERFDAVLCHGIWTFAVFSGAVLRAGVTPILFQHDLPDRNSPWYRWVGLRPPTVCIANSAYTARLVADWSPRSRVDVVYPLTELPGEPTADAVRALRSTLGADQNQLVILQGSRFDPLKGHRILLSALARLPHSPSWQCWIAGSPQRPQEAAYLRELEQIVAANRLHDRVRFIGHRQDMPLVLAASDVYCQLNQVPEAYGLVFVEALSLGKPVIALDDGGVTEVVTRECGFLCRPNAPDLASALERLLRDPARRARMGHAALARGAELNDRGTFVRRLSEVVAPRGA